MASGRKGQNDASRAMKFMIGEEAKPSSYHIYRHSSNLQVVAHAAAGRLDTLSPCPDGRTPRRNARPRFPRSPDGPPKYVARVVAGAPSRHPVALVPVEPVAGANRARHHPRG